MATRRYPISIGQAHMRIARAEEDHGPNHACKHQLGYRNGAIRSCDGLVAFSFVESPRTSGAYREIPYC